MKHSGLFENMKECTVCHRPLSQDYEKDLCPVCEENELFNRVKDFIRERDVTEYQVAEEFQLPLRKVKGWIKEGRIEYKEEMKPSIESLRCAECGEPITFGTYCQKCFKIKNTTKGTFVIQKNGDDRMRFLE